MALIQISRLSKKYKGVDFFAIDSLDLQIAKGEIFGLLGPNGAGKTTLLSMLGGWLKPSAGAIRIKGMTFRENKRQLQQLMGIVPQEYALYPTLTAYENLIYFGSMYGLHGNALKAKVKKALVELGLEPFIHQKISTYSGGMKRRVNLIAGTLHAPDILFLDEPTVGVDVQSKTIIFDHLKKINNSGTTLIYTSHLINEAQQFCTDLAILNYGRIVVRGKPEELLQRIPNATTLEEVFIALTSKAPPPHV